MAKTVNLRKELTEEKHQFRSDNERQQSPETKLLMGYNDSEDLKVLRYIGLDHNIQVAENLKGKNIELAQLEEKHGEVYTFDMIKKIALRYRLKFALASRYRGLVDNVTALHVREYMKSQNLSYESKGEMSEFFILAPYEAFENDAKSLEDSNPMLFCRIGGSQSQHFRLIYKWGKDFTDWKYVKAWPIRSPETLAICLMTAIFMVSYFLFSLCFPTVGLIESILINAVFGIGFGFVSSIVISE